MSFWTNNKQPSTPQPHSQPQVQPQPQPLQPPPSHQAKEEIPMSMTKRDETPAGAGPSGDLLLGQGAEFEGKLTFAGTVRIDAKFKGSILTNDVLVVGEHARIDADITCGTVIVYGEVNGNVKAKTAVELRHPGKMRGNVESPSLSIEKGVIFQGESRLPGTERAAPERPAPERSSSEKAAERPGAPKPPASFAAAAGT